MPGPHPAALSLPILNSTGEKNNMEKLVAWGKNKQIAYEGSRLQLLPENLLLCGLLSTGCSSYKEPAPAWALHRLQGTHPAAAVQHPPQTAVRRSALLCSSMGCRGTSCLTLVCTTGCRGISVPALGAAPIPPYTDLGVCRVVALTYFHFSLRDAAQHFLPLLQYLFQKQQQLMGAALGSDGPTLYLIRTGFHWHWSSFLALLRETVPAAHHPQH